MKQEWRPQESKANEQDALEGIQAMSVLYNTG